MKMDLFYQTLICFTMGYFAAKFAFPQKRRGETKDFTHACEPHHCNNLTESVVCLERPNGELWIKEYGTDNKPEGRTYRVNICPWCGKKSKKLMEGFGEAKT